MISKWAGLGLGLGFFTVAWLGCGGSEATTNGSSSSGGTTDSGSETSTTSDSGPSDSGGGSTVDVKFDGNIDAPEVTITYGTCPAFTPCGGDEKGTWKVTGGCLSDEIVADAKTACPGFTTSNEVIKAKGIVTADGTNVVRQTQVKLTAKAFVPFTGSCAQAGGNCQLLALGATQLGFDKATCVAADGGGGCDCDVEQSVVNASSATYTKSGNTITTSGGDTFDYCVAGAKLSYKQTNGQGNQPPFPLVLELAK